MSKFKKILVLTLMLTLTLTAFAVVSLAAEEPKAVNVGGHKTDLTFETGFTVGKTPFTGTGNPGTNGGIFISEAYPGGNKYLELIGSTGDRGTTRYDTFIATDYGRRTTYTLGNYPIVAIDFDVMTPDGNWGLFEAGHISNNATIYFRPYIDRNEQGDIFNHVDFGGINLSSEKGLWQHVTVVFELSYDNYGESQIDQSVYVNGGEQVYKYPTLNMTRKYPTINASSLFIAPIYFRTSRYLGSHQAIDNIQFTYFEEGYDIKSVPTYIYNDNYEMPYGVTVASIDKDYYDSFPKAIEAAKPGDVIKLVSDIEEVVNIDKTVIFDTNKYDTKGNPTGEYYSINNISSTTLVRVEEEGFISFKQVQNASLQIYWDDCPGAAAGGACACPDVYLDENGKHIMEAFTPYAMLNSIPLYPGDIPEFPMVGATAKRFVGWSLKQGGKPIELTAITSEQISDGWLSLYPVYEQYTYDFEVIDKDGVSTFYPGDTADEVKSVFSEAPTDSTIKLHSDVYAPAIALSNNKTLTLDLNGYQYYRQRVVVTQYKATYNEETEGYVKGEEINKVTTGSTGPVFYVDKKDYSPKFTITSSRPGAVMSTLSVYQDQWVFNGEVVKEVVADVMGGGSILFSSPSTATFNILGENITFYALSIYVADWGGDQSVLNVDGGTFYGIPSKNDKDVYEIYEGMFSVRTGRVHTIKNATIYCNGYLLSKNTSTPSATYDQNTQYIFEGCQIYSATLNNIYKNDVYIFEDCLVDIANLSGSMTIKLGHNTFITADMYDKYAPKETDASETKDYRFSYDEGVTIEDLEQPKTCDYIKISGSNLVLDSVTLLPLAIQEIDPLRCIFKYRTYDPKYAPTEVTFKDFDGNVISTVTANQNKPLVTPSAVVLGDGFRAVTNPIWINEADGTALGETLGSEESYVFKATLPETPVYEANLTVAMMNMAYYSGFTYNVYLPKTDDAQFISVCGEALSGVTVFIEGKEYYLYTVSVDPTGTLDDLMIDVKYSVDGAEYTEEFVLSAYVYALGSMESDKHTAEDKAASAALIKYIEELYKYVAGGEALSADITAKLDSFYAKYPSQPYATEYPESEVCELDGEVMDEYIKSVYFRISKGSRIGLAVELTDEALAAGYTLKVNGADFDVANGGLFYTASLPVYLTLMNPVHEIDILDADGADVATIEYSMATYITAMEAAGQNVDVVKALYAFGKATLAVRNSIFNS